MKRTVSCKEFFSSLGLRLRRLACHRCKASVARRKLYIELCDEKYANRPYRKEGCGEQMELVEEVIRQYWKPRYLLDHATRTAIEFMDGGENLKTVRADDIMWDTLAGMTGIEMARNLNAHFPTHVCGFQGGVALVSWQINPDGRYFMDEDGYGMTDDNEETIYGYIDKRGRVVEKFRAISHTDELKQMELEAKENAKK